jgi:MFS transporter, CP family, cyanate transporter
MRAGALLVEKYFPDRQAAMITVFSLLMQAGATLPALTAIPHPPWSRPR